MNKVIGFDELAYNHRKVNSSFYADPATPHTFYSMIRNPVSTSIYSWLYTDYTPEVPVPAPPRRYYALRLISDSASGILENVQIGVQSRDSFSWRIAPTGSNGPMTSSILSGSASGGSDGIASIAIDPRTAPYIEQSNLYWLVLDFGATGNVPMLAASALDIPAYSVVSSIDQTLWLPLNDDHTLAVGKVSITVGPQTLVSPNMYDLTGVPYCFLKIPEIEAHLYRSRAFQPHNYPLAKFKLSIIGFSSDRFDFSTVQPRPFHPIGKLSCMTLQFVGSDGFIYDFMGINVSLTMVIRYYVPRPKKAFDNRILNPNYQPDTTVQNPEEDSEDDQSQFESSDSDF